MSVLKFSVPVLSACLFFACSSEGIKEKINKAGDMAGQATGEFVDGARKGLNKSFDVSVNLDAALAQKGLQLGKTSVASDSSGTDNLLVVYVIFNQDFEGKLTARAFDENNLEMGRVAIEASGKKDEAGFLEFHFGKHTNLDSKNKLQIE